MLSYIEGKVIWGLISRYYIGFVLLEFYKLDFTAELLSIKHKLLCSFVHSSVAKNRTPSSWSKQKIIHQWHPTPELLPGKSHGPRSLVGCSPWGHYGSDTTEATSLSLFTFMHWRRKWQPTPVFLSGESQGRGTLVGCRLWGRTKSDTTEAT